MTEAEIPTNLVDYMLQAFSAAGAENGIVYVSVPITSGEGELRAMKREGYRDRVRFRSDHPAICRELQSENEQTAIAIVEQVRELFPYVVVVSPISIAVAHWGQVEYGEFWDRVIEEFAVRVVAGPGWAMSRGARREINTALRLGVPLLDVAGRACSYEDLAKADSEARATDLISSWSQEDIDHYFSPRLVSESLVRRNSGVPTVAIDREAAEIFAWLRGERGYQVRKFGTEQDDNHTREGLGQEGWWWRQFMNYYYRAQVLGLELPNGRQALAKFVATACGLLESTVRLYGPLPAPGVPSGENIDTAPPPNSR